jgi:hypothetical protein
VGRVGGRSDRGAIDVPGITLSGVCGGGIIEVKRDG